MIAEVVVGLEVNKVFDYDAGMFPSLKKGMRVWIEFGRKKQLGFVVNLKDKQSVAARDLKPVLEVLDSESCFTPDLLGLSREISKNYLYSRGEILKRMLPAALRKKRRFSFSEPEHELTERKKQRIKYIRENLCSSQRLSHYEKIIKETLSQGSKVIVCVPYKQDACRMGEFLKERIKGLKVSFLFGAEKESVQQEEWQKVRSGQADVCIGNRFVVFAPFQDLGLIIVEKENFYGYFQPEKPYYHLRDLALMRAERQKAALVLHSDFPSLEVYQLLQSNNAEFIELTKKTKPNIKIFDLNNYKLNRYPVFSGFSLEIIRKYLEKNKKIAVFWNRKGFSYVLRCKRCKQVLKCPECDNLLIFSLKKNVYICNKCGKVTDTLSKCPKCKEGLIQNIGVGIERAEANLSSIFPNKKIVTLTDKTQENQDWDILLCTQKILFLNAVPVVDLVVISGLDYFYSAGDYSASMELFFLLVRLKNIAKEEFIAFTLQPDYYPFKALYEEDWQWIYKKELSIRDALKLPPYFHIAKVTLRQKKEDSLLKAVSSLKKIIEKNIDQAEDINIYGPLKEIPFKKSGQYYYYLIVKSKGLNELRAVLDKSLCKFKKSSAKMSLVIT